LLEGRANVSRDLLIADANERDLRDAADALAPLGLPLRTAQSPEALFELLVESAPELVVLGLRSDGPELVRQVRGRALPFTPLVLTVPAAAPAQAVVVREVDDVINKPIDHELFATRVRSLLRVRQQLSELNVENQQLKQALAAQRELAEFFVHDIRNPLTVVQYNVMYAQASSGSDPEEVQFALGEAADAARRIQRYSEDLLAIAEGDGPGLRLTAQRFALAHLVSALVREVDREAQARGITLDMDVPPGLRVEGDRELLTRVVENLLRNALRHTLAGGRIHISAQEGREVEIAVCNTGAVIPTGERGLLFERFGRADGPPAGQPRGIGIGLYFCRHAVAAHGGTITLEDRQGWSTSFVVRLPRRVRGVLKCVSDSKPARRGSTNLRLV
jgi:signal transduction histidine kinase